VFSSKVLLENIITQHNSQGKTFFHIDATYKLLTNGFTLLTLGTENASHNFRLIACAISAHENTIAYEEFLKSIKRALKEFYEFDWKPVYVIMYTQCNKFYISNFKAHSMHVPYSKSYKR